jgi:Signal peptidase, peptidase S26
VRRLLLGILTVSTLLAGLATGRVLRRFVVEGRSMLRAYAPGDRLLVEAVSYQFRRPRVGEAVVVRWPNALSRPPGSPALDLKRIAAGPGAEVTVTGQADFLGVDEWYLLGDNMDESTDSRTLGPVRTHDIVGRVWRKY